MGLLAADELSWLAENASSCLDGRRGYTREDYSVSEERREMGGKRSREEMCVWAADDDQMGSMHGDYRGMEKEEEATNSDKDRVGWG